MVGSCKAHCGVSRYATAEYYVDPLYVLSSQRRDKLAASLPSPQVFLKLVYVLYVTFLFVKVVIKWISKIKQRQC